MAQSAYAAQKTIIETITANDNVRFYWLIVKADFDDDDEEEEEIKSVSLAVITELYLRIFIWVEKFKQLAKKASKNQKSLKRTVHSKQDK